MIVMGRLIILGLLLLGACAPKVEDRPFEPAKSDFGPRTRDTDLSEKIKSSEFITELTWQGKVATSIYFQQAENLIALGKYSNRVAISKLGASWIQKFTEEPKATSSSYLGDSPFAAIAATATEDEVRQTLDEVHADLNHSRAIFKKNILQIGAEYPFPQKSASLVTVISKASHFVSTVLEKIETMGLSKIMADGVREELKQATDVKFDDVQKVIPKFYSEKNFPSALATVDALIRQMQIELPEDAKNKLQLARIVSHDLENLNDAQGGLTILIDIWRMLTPGERDYYVKSENEALYDFLKAQDERSLECLRKAGCSSGIFQGIKKALFILPRINEYGVENLKRKLNEKTLERLIQEVELRATAFLKSLPQTIAEQIDAGLVSKNNELRTIQKNYSAYLNGLLNKWAERVFPTTLGKVKSFETPSLTLHLVKNRMSITPSCDTLEPKAVTDGASMSAAASLLEANTQSTEARTQLILSQVNQLIATGGYRDDDKKLSSASGATENLVQIKNFSAEALAEQIKGLSHLLQITADWKKSAFDHTLGKVRAQDLTRDIQSPALNRPLFPKDSIFALNLGNVAVLLKNITKHATPVFLITLENKTIWADQFISGGKDSPIMAGLVDIKDGKRVDVVRSKDVGNFLLALSDFLNAIDGFENTKSPFLRERGDENSTPIESLQEGRKELRLLVIALANFISNQLMNEKSIVQNSYSLSQMQRSEETHFTVENQVIAMRALISAWKTTKIEAYLYSAQEIYFAMNKHSYRAEEGFYVDGDGGSLAFPQRVLALRGINELKPHLPLTSQVQLVKISAPWLKALEELQ